MFSSPVTCSFIFSLITYKNDEAVIYLKKKKVVSNDIIFSGRKSSVMYRTLYRSHGHG